MDIDISAFHEGSTITAFLDAADFTSDGVTRTEVLLAACDYAESHPETYNLDLMIPLKDIDKNRSDLEGIGFTTIAGHQDGCFRLRKKIRRSGDGGGPQFSLPTNLGVTDLEKAAVDAMVERYGPKA
jgi:hypothetical protein